MASKAWTLEEIQILKDNYVTLGPQGCMALLPGRTRSAILSKALELKLNPCVPGRGPGFKDLTGQKFNKLTVIKLNSIKISPGGKKTAYWDCMCDCGNSSIVTSSCLKSTKSCYNCGKQRMALINATPKPQKSLLDLHPELCKEWSDKNELGPENYNPGSQTKVWWKCLQGHGDYLQNILSRTGRKHGCPKCGKLKCRISRKIPKLNKSLLDLYPELCKEWSDKNELGPENYYPASHAKAWWRCPKCLLEYYAGIGNRTRLNNGCPKCCLSKGEKLVTTILDNKRIKFNSQYKFKNCCFIRPLPFDFALFYKRQLIGLIEFNGEQHYIDRGRFKHRLPEIQQRDKIKVHYCKANDIPLLIIKYDTPNKEIKKLITAFWKECREKHLTSTAAVV